MKNTNTSQSGKKEATIVYTISGYRVTIVQLTDTGIGIERDFIMTKNIATGEKAYVWAMKQIDK